MELRDSTDDLCLTVITSPEAPLPPHPTRDGNPVLSSVENLSQWKEAKSRWTRASRHGWALPRRRRATPSGPTTHLVSEFCMMKW
ncbi:hypothetical protein GUJ93_ZPchr0006g42077 [Zizania palustris]|uniref:Uncharacterized protein n=1 Tax=Zizania palustris TaxID=103762 RepID=A0A8J5TAP8_ZIZPA|nr:hypothetical protein GUJ93_ZPchr0006g42077 [Zizania palustris]